MVKSIVLEALKVLELGMLKGWCHRIGTFVFQRLARDQHLHMFLCFCFVLCGNLIFS